MRPALPALALPLFGAALLALAVDAAAFPQSTHPAMTDPSKATDRAPDSFRAKFETTKGDVVFACTRSWAPNGVDRFYNLVKIGFFDDVALFRVKKDFVVQWGIHGDPKVMAAWRDANLPPDPPTQSNTKGMLTYAMAGRPDTRSTQLFINFKDNTNLDAMGFAPICKVEEGMEVAEKFYGEYGERVTGKQGDIQMKGNAYLKEAWPELDYIKTATIAGEAPNTLKGEPGAPKPEEGGNTTLYVIGAIVVGGLVLMLLTNRKEPERSPAKPGPSGRAVGVRERARTAPGTAPEEEPEPETRKEPSVGGAKKKKKKAARKPD